MESQIPRRIIHVGEHNMSVLAKAAVANARLLNPGFEYLLFDDREIDEFIGGHFPEYRDAISSFRFRIQRYDFFRYLAVYHLGGFYLDLDVFLACGLEDLLQFPCVFPFEELTMHSLLRTEYGMDWEIGNYAFGAVPGHPFLRAIINNCMRAQRDPEWAQTMIRSIPRMFRQESHVLCTTGPALVSRTLAEYPNAAHEVTVLFPENVCDPDQWHRFGRFGVHLMAGSWHRPRVLWLRGLRDIRESRIRKKLLEKSRMLGNTRTLEFSRKGRSLT